MKPIPANQLLAGLALAGPEPEVAAPSLDLLAPPPPFPWPVALSPEPDPEPFPPFVPFGMAIMTWAEEEFTPPPAHRVTIVWSN